MKKYFQPEIETMPREQIKEIQNDLFVKQFRRVYENVPYYRAKVDAAGVNPDEIQSIADIGKLPFLTKDDLREAYPDGLLAVPKKDVVRIHSTSGTTGKRVVAYYTQNDLDLWSDCTARAIVATGGSEDDVVQISYGYGLFTGGAGLNDGAHKLGALTVPMSSGNTDRQLQFMEDMQVTVLCCTPSYASFLGGTLKKNCK